MVALQKRQAEVRRRMQAMMDAAYTALFWATEYQKIATRQAKDMLQVSGRFGALPARARTLSASVQELAQSATALRQLLGLQSE